MSPRTDPGSLDTFSTFRSLRRPDVPFVFASAWTNSGFRTVSSPAGISHTLVGAMDNVLERIILGRLDADDKLAERTRALVIGACHGAESLDTTLEGKAPEPSRAEAKAPSSRNPAYIQAIEVHFLLRGGPP